MQRPYRKYKMTIYVTDQWTAGDATKPLPKRELIKQVEGNELAGLYITVDRNSFELLEELSDAL